MSKQNTIPRVNYYVDEAGDSTIYSKHGKILIGKDGCSYYFMLGYLSVPNPEELASQLEELRIQLLSDPYFQDIPSMQISAKKTAIAFHAKDDVPEVRREVFRLIMAQEGLRFFAVVRDKHRVSEEYIERRLKYNPNILYDSLVSRLFRDGLHKAEELDIYFAKRGTSDRTHALKDALEKAKLNFKKKWQIENSGLLNVYAIPSSENICLQAVDYVLWALQRVYERREERYFAYVREICRLVHDVDDTRGAKYGVYYTARNNPLTVAKLKPLKD